MPAIPQAERILDCALVLAERQGWERLRLAEIATELGLGLDAVRRCYRQKDDLVDAWFDRADSAMLRRSELPDLSRSDRVERIATLLMAWLGALAGHRQLTGQMLLYKLEPGHVHLQVLGVLRISRTVQWLREAAGLDAHHARRIVEEVALTSIYLATFAYWLQGTEPVEAHTRDFLRRQLTRAQALGCWP